MHFTPLPTHLAVPRAGVDPIDDDRSALALLSALIDRPLQDQLLLLLLDDRRIGHIVTIVDDTAGHDDAVVEAVQLVAMSATLDPALSHLVLASVRPGRDIVAGDVDRWLEASATAHAAGVTLLEWYVISERGVVCPRDLIGEPPRW